MRKHQLYRMVYVREGKVRGITFSFPTERRASDFATTWVEGFNGQLLTVMPISGKMGTDSLQHLAVAVLV